jgi:hypothetical protein
MPLTIPCALTLDRRATAPTTAAYLIEDMVASGRIRGFVGGAVEKAFEKANDLTDRPQINEGCRNECGLVAKNETATSDLEMKDLL